MICFVILQFDVFESLKLFLMREGFVFCSVLVVGVNTGTLVNLVLPDFDSPLLSAPPQTAHIYTHKFEYRNIFILLIIVIPSHARSAPSARSEPHIHYIYLDALASSASFFFRNVCNNLRELVKGLDQNSWEQ